jgi:hypothetical protein
MQNRQRRQGVHDIRPNCLAMAFEQFRELFGTYIGWYPHLK